MGKFLAVVSLTPFAIITAYLTLIFMVRDIRVVSPIAAVCVKRRDSVSGNSNPDLFQMFMFLGQLANEVTALIMKNYFKHGRPPHEAVYLKIYGKADHGYGG